MKPLPTYPLPPEDQGRNDVIVLGLLRSGLSLDVRAMRMNCYLTPEAIDAALRRLAESGQVRTISPKPPYIWRSI